MCVAAIPAGVQVALTVLSTAAAAYGQYQQSQAQKQSAAYNAQAAANEAATQQQLAQNEIAKGAAERNRHLRAGARQMGELRSGMAAGGFELNSGTNLSLLDEGAQEIGYDANVISNNAAMSAWSHLNAANNANNQSQLYTYQRDNAGKGSLLGIGGTILGGVASGINQWNGYQQTKTPASSARRTNPLGLSMGR